MTDKECFDELCSRSMSNNMGCGAPTCAMVIIVIMFLFCSCATRTKVEYVDREVVRYETKIQHDTLINNIHDSVVVKQQGDTVFVDRWHTQIREKIKERVDTCYRDSIQTQIKETAIEKKIIPKWCYFSLLVCGIFLIFAFVKLSRWLRRKI